MNNRTKYGLLGKDIYYSFSRKYFTEKFGKLGLTNLKYQNFIKNNQLEDRIFYTGFEHEMDKFYSSIDILILPSQLPDPLPTVVLEAMQYGIPVAATAQGGALEMIAENETGIFIPINKVQVAADKIFELIHSNHRNNMRTQTIERVEKYFSASSFENQITTIFH